MPGCKQPTSRPASCQAGLLGGNSPLGKNDNDQGVRVFVPSSLAAESHRESSLAYDGLASARLEGGLNTYLYANANPLRYIDPTGNLGIDTILKTILNQALEELAKALAGHELKSHGLPDPLKDPGERGAEIERDALRQRNDATYQQCLNACKNKSNQCMNRQDPLTWQSSWDDLQSCTNKCSRQYEDQEIMIRHDFPL